MRKTVLCTACLIMLGLLTSGCATMIHGSTQRVAVRTNPGGATVKVSGQVVTTPGSVKLARDDFHTLIISKNGYKTSRMNLRHEESSLPLLDIALMVPALLPGAIAYLVDTKTGAGWNLSPDEVDVVLEKTTSDKAPAAQHEPEIVPRPDLSPADMRMPLNNDKKVRICVLADGPPPTKIRVLDGDNAIGVLKKREYVCWERTPGSVNVVAQSFVKNAMIDVPTEGGKTYFLRWSFSGCKLALLDAATAEQTLKRYTPVKPAKYVPFE